jgi:hypothetical protein
MPDEADLGEGQETVSGREFDLKPHPRILVMLGEIDLHQWKCVAELVDNAIDGFVRAEQAGKAVESPEIRIQLPTVAGPNARISVRDNGPGMDPDTLENAVRAGWTSNDPMGSLGLFGMGFNIATARLGQATTVWSSGTGDETRHGVRIRFDELTEQGHFKTPMLESHKPDRDSSGTEVVIERLKPEQQEWFAKPANRTKVLRHLEQVYAAILRDEGKPVGLRMYVNNRALRGQRHCVWGEDRTVHHRKYGDISAFHEINTNLPTRLFCFNCWYWLPSNRDSCPSCGKADQVVERERRIYGWLGIQRHVHETAFGIDFIRQGRKIERANKELFDWTEDETTEREYPIDDPRHRGRIVGEIHLDHCRVTYTKDHFDRNDHAWADMIRVVRGEGPLRPEKATQAGFGPNQSPLFLLFQAFRRHNPKTKVAGGYRNLLAVPDNERAMEMARLFHQDDPEYQTDEKWYKLIEEAERALLVDDGTGDSEDEEDDFWDGDDEDTDQDDAGGEDATPTPERQSLPSLSRRFVEDASAQSFHVQSFAVADGDPDLPVESAWSLSRHTTGEYTFLVRQEHSVFRSVTLTPLDALIAELAWSAVDFMRGHADEISFGDTLTGLRLKYGGTADLDPVHLSAAATAALRGIASAPARQLDPIDAKGLFDELPAHTRRHVLDKLAALGSGDAGNVESGRFLEYVPWPAVQRFFEEHPEFFFDGKYWDLPYETMDLGDTEATDAARIRAVRTRSALISDAIWLAEQDAEDLSDAGRTRLMRAALSLDLLMEDLAEPE